MAYGPYIDNESDGFGVPGVEIKPTLSSPFDPYSGINLLNGASCTHIEVVTNNLIDFTILPPASSSADGINYIVNESPYYANDDIANYMSQINCSTEINQNLSFFNSMIAQCSDGTSVVMAENIDTPFLDFRDTQNQEITYQNPKVSDFIPNFADGFSPFQEGDSLGIPAILNEPQSIIDGEIHSFYNSLIELMGKKYCQAMTGDSDSFVSYELAPDSNDYLPYAYWSYLQPFQDIDLDTSGAYISGFLSRMHAEYGHTEGLQVDGADGKTYFFNWTKFNYFDLNDNNLVDGSQEFAAQGRLLNNIVCKQTATVFFNNGIDACDSRIENINSDAYLATDSDKRPSLGLFSTLTENISNKYFSTPSSEPIFSNISKDNLVPNHNGSQASQLTYDWGGDEINDTTGLGYNIDEDGDTIFIPKNWDYMAMDGIGYTMIHPIPHSNPPDTWPGGEYQYVPEDWSQADNPAPPLEGSGGDYLGYGGWCPYIYVDAQNFAQVEDLDGSMNSNSVLYGNEYFNGDDGKYSPLFWLKHKPSLDEAIMSEFAYWVQSNECYSKGRCLKFKATPEFWQNIKDESYIEELFDDFSYHKDLFLRCKDYSGQQYTTLNQQVRIYNRNDMTLKPYTSLTVKFKMKTTDITGDEMPAVEAGVYRNNPGVRDTSEDFPYEYDNGGSAYTFSKSWLDTKGRNNSINGASSNSQYRFGGMQRFENNQLNVWETKQFTFYASDYFNHPYYSTSGVCDNGICDGNTIKDGTNCSSDTDCNRPNDNPETLNNLWFFTQAGNDFKGTVYLDDFEVFPSGEFKPDVDVRKRKGPDDYGIADLTEYYDSTINPTEYADTLAPLEVQFYFYPRYPKENPFNSSEVMYHDFRKGLFYIYDIDWGDGSPKEFTSTPEQLFEDKALYHTYETSGIFEIKANMIRLQEDSEDNSEGVIHNRKFTLRININEGGDEDFLFFDSNGFEFIPYRNVLPMVGGISKESIYYKSLVRNLGIVEDNLVEIEFNNEGDRLKNEIALSKIDNYYNNYFTLLEEFQKPRYAEPFTGELVEYNRMALLSLQTGGGTITFAAGPILNIDYWQDDISFYMVEDFANMFQDACVAANPDLIDTQQLAATTQVANMFGPNPLNDSEEYNELWTVYNCVANTMQDLNGNPIDEPPPPVFNGLNIESDTFGKALGDVDINTIRYFNQPKSMSEILGFDCDTFSDDSINNYVKNNDFLLGNLYWTEQFTCPIPETDFIFEDGVALSRARFGNQYNSINLLNDANRPDVKEENNYQFTIRYSYYADTNTDYVPKANISFYDPNSNWSRIRGFNLPPTGNDNDYNILQFTYKAKFDKEAIRIRIGYGKVTDSNNGYSCGFGDADGYCQFATGWQYSECYDFRNYGERCTIDPSGGNGCNADTRQPEIYENPVQLKIDSIQISNTDLSADYDGSLNTLDDFIFTPYSENLLSGNCIEYTSDNPNSETYWGNIIPENYSIFNREGIDLEAIDSLGTPIIDSYSQQNWLPDIDGNTPYYPVLPRYQQDGTFGIATPNGNIPFPQNGPITDESYWDESMIVSITSEEIETGVFDDNGGNNKGFVFSDFKPQLNKETFQPIKTKKLFNVKKSKTNGAF